MNTDLTEVVPACWFDVASTSFTEDKYPDYPQIFIAEGADCGDILDQSTVVGIFLSCDWEVQ